ncbi:MAG TPA: iron ABC transporter [Planctomycetaceae bacterium]|nr:iron ABC transporter [Planctomycetaceae bacterium]
MFDAWLRTLTLQDHNTRVVVIATTLLGFAAGAIGSFTLLRRRALMGDALSHAMLPGIGLAFLVAPALGLQAKSLPVLLGGAVASGLVGTFAILLIRHQTRLKEDAALGIVLSVFFGAGLAILGLVQQTPGGHAAGLESFIYGKTASVTTYDALWIAGTAAATILIVVLFAKELTLLCFDDSYARARGFSVVLLDILLMSSVVMVTVVGLQAVGLILMIALLVTPAAASRFWVNRIIPMLWLSAIIGAVSCLGGSLLSAGVAELPSGATIVLTAAALFFVSLLLGTERGILVRWIHRRSMRLKTDRQHVLRGLYEIVESYRFKNLATDSSRPGQSSKNQVSRSFDGEESAFANHESLVSIVDLFSMRTWSKLRLKRELKRCQADGLIKMQQETVCLTAAGREAANRATREHRLWELYLITHADVAPSRVDHGAERIEHVLEPEMIAELEQLLPASSTRSQVPDCPHSETDSIAGDALPQGLQSRGVR